MGKLPSFLASVALFCAVTQLPSLWAAEPRSLRLDDVIKLSASVASVDLARLDAAIAHAGYGIEQAALRPRIDAVGSWTRQRLYLQTNNVPYALTPDNTVDARLRVGQAIIDLESWGRVRAAARRLEAAEAATTASLEAAASNAAAAFVALASADAYFEVRSQDLALAEELLKLAEAQVNAGASEGIAVTRAETRVAAARTALTAAEGNRRTSSITLARALRLDPAITLSCGDPLIETMGQSTVSVNNDEALKTAFQSRPELRVSLKLIAALHADYHAAQGARLPSIDAFADAGRIGPTTDDTTTTWRMGLEVRIPLLNGQNNVVDATHLRLEQQHILFADLKENIAAEVRTAIVYLETGQAGLASATHERQLAEQELRESRQRFAAGVAGNLEVIDAQRNLANARDRVVTALTTLVQARIGLSRAAGVATTLH
jgi:outer membrane protein TolC